MTCSPPLYYRAFADIVGSLSKIGVTLVTFNFPIPRLQPQNVTCLREASTVLLTVSLNDMEIFLRRMNRFRHHGYSALTGIFGVVFGFLRLGTSPLHSAGVE